MNPILPIQHFVPDVEARQWSDGQLYLYGSYDLSGRTSYCSWEYHVFSSADLIHWQDHGESFRSAPPNASLDWMDSPLFAPDCIYHNGRYYLFFCGAGNQEGVAESLSPTGPFTNAVPIEGANEDAIDPAVLVDDGDVYLYWGQFHLRGAKLNPDMRSVDTDTLVTDLITEADHGFHEGASIRKHGDTYYLLYADISRKGRPTCLGYATSDSPLGPFTKRGIVIDNAGCDPQTWNNHGSIAEFNGQWYVFYHRSSQNSNYNRRVCVEPIKFDADGTIDEVEMTTQGVGEPLPANQAIEAWRACLLNGHVHTAAASPTENDPTVREYLTQIHHEDWAGYKYVDFDKLSVNTFHARVGSLAYGGVIEVRLDQPDGELIGTCSVPQTGGWQKWETVSCPINKVDGIRAVYLVFKGVGNKFVIREFDPERLFDLDRFWFE